MASSYPPKRGLGDRVRRAAARFRGPGAWRAWGGLMLLLLLVAYLIYIFTRSGLPEIDVRALLAEITLRDLALAALLYGITLVFAVVGWALIMGTLSGYRGMFEHARIYILTSVTRRLPGTFWYMLGRVVLYERLGIARGLTAVASGLEFAAMVLGGLLVTLLSWPLVFGAQNLNPAVLLIPLLACAVLLNPPLVRALIRRFGRAAGTPPVRYRQMLLWVAVYAVIWCVGGVLLFVLVRAVAPVPLSTLPVIIGVWATAGVAAVLFFSFLPFGLGAAEVTTAALLSPFVAPDEALFVALALRVILTICELGYGLLGGLLYLPDLLARRGPFAPPPELDPHQEAVQPEEVAVRAAGIPPK
jgi:uncharacterized membrane protein YbhN (UPF0104 family)